MKSKENVFTVLLPSHPILPLLRLLLTSWLESSESRSLNEAEGKNKGVVNMERGILEKIFCNPSLNI